MLMLSCRLERPADALQNLARRLLLRRLLLLHCWLLLVALLGVLPQQVRHSSRD
jgi:hypothetical protein